ncbi:MAG: NAD(P)H-dependent oxidoreductase [Bacteroidales bacterium]|jgi:glutathione-regulated potassium-efflux system ancillary protein KefG|nr:NAD(P)H-dependent oxidoreductase [Bacteroidales bacterium]
MITSGTKKILILFAHPALEKSRVNIHLAEAAKGIEDVHFHDLYEEYPDFHIDVQREQELLSHHDIIIFHHPFFWYSTPAILKEWQDLVLEHGWAYGSQGNALKGKLFMNVITTGGKEMAYHAEGHNHFTVRQLLAPVEQTANLCKMIFIAPFIVHGTHSITSEDIIRHSSEYRELLTAMRENRLDAEAARRFDRINDHFNEVIQQLSIN